MRIVITGDTGWECRELATRVLRRLVARYGPDIIIIHGNESGVDSSFAAAAKELGVTAEARVIDRNGTCFPSVGARNRELFMGGARRLRPCIFLSCSREDDRLAGKSLVRVLMQLSELAAQV